MFRKIIFGFLISNLVLFACNSMDPSGQLKTNLGELKSSLSKLKTKLTTLNTKLGELRGKLGEKPSMEGSYLSINRAALLAKIAQYQNNIGESSLATAMGNISAAEKSGQKNKEIESSIPKTTKNLEITGDDTAISSPALDADILLIQNYFTELKTFKLKNFKFLNNHIYDIKFKDLDVFELENIENLCALNFKSKINVIKISNCDQLGDTNVAKGNAKALAGISEWPKNVQQISITGCKKLRNLKLQNFTQLTNLDLTGCVSLNFIDIVDCSKIETINLTGCADLTRVQIWTDCSKLTTIKIPKALEGKPGIFNFAPKDKIESKIVWVS